jgi:hypothetical protein
LRFLRRGVMPARYWTTKDLWPLAVTIKPRLPSQQQREVTIKSRLIEPWGNIRKRQATAESWAALIEPERNISDGIIEATMASSAECS